MAVLSRMFTLPHELNWDVRDHLRDDIRDEATGVFVCGIVAGGNGVRVNFVRVGLFLECDGSKSSCVELVTITAFLHMNVHSMSFR